MRIAMACVALRGRINAHRDEDLVVVDMGGRGRRRRGRKVDDAENGAVSRWRHSDLGLRLVGSAAQINAETRRLPVALVTGLIAADAPRWMPVALGMWWIVMLGVFVVLRRAGRCIDTYQAIWELDRFPGNRRRPIGLGIVRLRAQPAGRHQKRTHRVAPEPSNSTTGGRSFE